jgi:hypothetical protein
MRIYAVKRLEIHSDDGMLDVRCSDIIDPKFRIEITISQDDDFMVSVLDLFEAKAVRDKLSEFIETRNPKVK